MKTKLLFIILICYAKLALSQNMIQNNSFENYTNNSGGFINGPGDGYLTNFWNLQPTTGTPDYFNPICNNVNYRVPQNITGNLDAKDGNAYIGIATSKQNDAQIAEYIATTITLTQGATYEFKMNISLAGSCAYKTNLGVNIVSTLNPNGTPNAGPRNYVINTMNGNKMWPLVSTAEGA